MSADSADVQKRFVATLSLPFRLLTDTKLAVAKAYGVHIATGKGGLAARSVFLVDRRGKLRFVDRAFKVPTKLDGTPLQAAIDALLGKPVDPLAALKDLPADERAGKTLLTRYVQAVLAEKVSGLKAVLHPAYATRTGQPDSDRDRRQKQWLDRHRALFAKHELAHQVAFADTIDLTRARVLSGAAAQAAAAHIQTPDRRNLDTILQKGDLLVTCRPQTPPKGTKRFLPAELILVARQHQGQYRLVDEGTR